jgi:hypothetical protein
MLVLNSQKFLPGEKSRQLLSLAKLLPVNLLSRHNIIEDMATITTSAKIYC